jgi:hypothetical protein
MNAQSYKYLNNLFPTDQSIEDVIKWKKTKVLPQNINYRRFTDKYHAFALNKDGYLTLNKLIVVPKSEIIEVCDAEFNSNVFTSTMKFYKYLCEKYINIKRKDVESFMSAQNIYSYTKKTRRVSKPIVAKYANQMWCIDLIDMSMFSTKNKNVHFILTCVDAFSRKTWLEKVKTKTSENVLAALKSIVSRASVCPDVLMSDNGAEFVNADIENWCREKNIKAIQTRSYSPESNGICERKNQEVRKILNILSVETQSHEWIDHLEAVENALNDTYSGVIKTSPNQLWVANKERDIERIIPGANLIANKKKQATEMNQKKQEKAVKDFRRTEDGLMVHDKVLLRMASLFSNFRKELKANNGKLLPVKYFPEAFIIDKIINPRKNPLERRKYVLVNSEDEELCKEDKKLRYFYASELQKVSEQYVQTMSNEKALQLCRIEESRGDVVY